MASRFHNLNYNIYYDDNKKKNVDFIIQKGLEKPIPIGVNCNKSQIKHAINNYNSPHGIIISNTTQNIVKEDNIIYIPPETFGFM